MSLHFGAVGVFNGDGAEVVLDGQLVVVSVVDAESVGFAVETVFCLPLLSHVRNKPYSSEKEGTDK